MGKLGFSGATTVCVADMLERHFDALATALEAFRDAVKCDCIAISWFEPGDDQVRILPYGLPELTEFESTPAMCGKTICCYPLVTRKPLAVREFETDAPEGHSRCNFMVAEGFQSYLAHPVLGLGPDIHIAVAALTREVRDWMPSDLAHARTAAQAIMLILGPIYGQPLYLQH